MENACTYECLPDKEYMVCDGQIRIWLHQDYPESVLNCVWNPWIGDYLSKKVQLDAQGIPLRNHCDYVYNINDICNYGYSFNTVNGQEGYIVNGYFFIPNGNGCLDDGSGSLLNIKRKKSNSCCCESNSCQCDVYYAFVKFDEMGEKDPVSNIFGSEFLSNYTTKEFFGKKWTLLFTLDSNVNSSKKISGSDLGCPKLTSAEIFMQNNDIFIPSSSNLNYRFGLGNSHIPTKEEKTCFDYYPAKINYDCPFPLQNAKMEITGSDFFPTVDFNDHEVGMVSSCSPFADYNACSFLISKESFLQTVDFFENTPEGRISIIHHTVESNAATTSLIGLYGLNQIGYSANQGGNLTSGTRTTFKTEFNANPFVPPLVTNLVRGDCNLNSRGFGSEGFYLCRYLGPTNFTAKPFSLTNTGVMYKEKNLKVEYNKETDLPHCDMINNPDGTVTFVKSNEPRDSKVRWLYYYFEYFQYIPSSITISIP